MLVECECVDAARGAHQASPLYSAVPDRFVGSTEWRRVPPSLYGRAIGASVSAFLDELDAAMEAGIGAEASTVLGWTTLILDEMGWFQLADFLESRRLQLVAVHNQSREQLRATGGRGSAVVVATAAFESAPREVSARQEAEGA